MQIGPNTELGDFILKSQIGNGEFGKVWLGVHKRQNYEAAIKINTVNDPAQLKRFNREGEILRSLNHPNIVPFWGFDIQGDILYIVMRYIKGKTLAEIIARRREISPPGTLMDLGEVDGIFFQLASALDYLHTAGVIHRDLKPSNIIIEDGTNSAIVTDFGLAKSTFDLTRTTVGVSFTGTLQYATPEQLTNNQPTPATDQYALASIIYELLTGNPPFVPVDHNPTALVSMILNNLPVAPTYVNSRLPVQLNLVFKQALQKDPALRFRSVMDFYQAFRGAIAQENINSAPTVSGYSNVSRPNPNQFAPEPFTLRSIPNLPIDDKSPTDPSIRELTSRFKAQQSNAESGTAPIGQGKDANSPDSEFATRASMPITERPPYDNQATNAGNYGNRENNGNNFQPFTPGENPGPSQMNPGPNGIPLFDSSEPPKPPSGSNNLKLMLLGFGVTLFIGAVVIVVLLLLGVFNKAAPSPTPVAVVTTAPATSPAQTTSAATTAAVTTSAPATTSGSTGAATTAAVSGTTAPATTEAGTTTAATTTEAATTTAPVTTSAGSGTVIIDNGFEVGQTDPLGGHVGGNNIAPPPGATDPQAGIRLSGDSNVTTIGSNNARFYQVAVGKQDPTKQLLAEFTIFDNTTLPKTPITAGMKLSYDIYVVTGTAHITVDPVMTDDTRTSNFKTPDGKLLTDNTGTAIYPSSRDFPLKQWNHFEVDLTPLAGKTIDRITVVWDDSNPDLKTFVAYIDNLRIGT